MTRQIMTCAVITGAVLAAFWCGVFFRGFDQLLFAPGLLAVALAGGVALATGFRDGEWHYPAAPVAGGLFLFAACVTASLVWSDVPYISTLFCMMIGSLPLLFFCVTQHPSADRIIVWLRVGLSLSLVALAAWAVVQFVFLRSVSNERIHHPMLNANNLAVLLSMGSFFLLTFFDTRKNTVRIAVFVLMILTVLGMLTTQSRGGALGLAMGAAVFVVTCRSFMARDWQWYCVLVLTMVIAVGAMMMELSAYTDGDMRLLGGSNAAASNENRYMLWGSALQMLRDHPMSGAGLGTFYLLFPRYRHVDDISDGYFLHLDPVQFGIETNMIVTVLFYVFATAVLVRTVRAVTATALGDPRRRVVMAPFCGLLVLMLNAHVNFDLYMLPALLCGAVLLMAWYRGTEQILGESRIRVSLRYPAMAAVVVPMLALVFLVAPLWIVRAGIAVHDAESAATALQDGDIDRARAATAHGMRYGPPSYYRIHYLDALWRGRVLQGLFHTLDARQRRDLFDQALASLDRAMAQNPYDVQAISHRALLYYTAYPRLDPRGLDRAIETLEHGMTIDPVSFDLRMGLARMLEIKGNLSRAIAVLEEGDRWVVTRLFAPAPYLEQLARLKQKSGDVESAERLRRAARDRAQDTRNRIAVHSAMDSWVRELLQR